MILNSLLFTFFRPDWFDPSPQRKRCCCILSRILRMFQSAESTWLATDRITIRPSPRWLAIGSRSGNEVLEQVDQTSCLVKEKRSNRTDGKVPSCENKCHLIGYASSSSETCWCLLKKVNGYTLEQTKRPAALAGHASVLGIIYRCKPRLSVDGWW